MKQKQAILVYLILFTMTTSSLFACITDSLKEKALAELHRTLQTQPEFIKVHAAEYLIWLGYPSEVKKEFLRENELNGNVPKYRIGIWRVLSQTETDPAKKQLWNDKIYRAFGDLNGPDRLHAAETLAKLQLSPSDRLPEATQQSLEDESRNMQVYTRWALSYSPNADVNQYRQEFLQLLARDTNKIVRLISAYIVRRTKNLTGGQWSELVNQALAEPETSDLKKVYFNTAVVTAPEEVKKTEQYRRLKHRITQNYQQFSAAERMELAQVLADAGDEADIDLLVFLLNDGNSESFYKRNSKEGADVRAAAAYAILKIKQRTGSK